MKLSDNTKILSTKIFQKKSFSVVKNDFKILDLERYLQHKKYLVSGECMYSDSILIIISSENEGYKKYLGTSEYESSLYTIIDVFSRLAYAEYRRNLSNKASFEVVLNAQKYFGFKAI